MNYKIEDIDQKIENSFLSNKELANKQLETIISRMPYEVKSLIEYAFLYKRIPKEYLLSSIFFAFSNASGLAFSVKSFGYKNYPNLYLAIIGSRGDCKSPAMETATQPLVEFDNKKYEEFIRESNDSTLEREKATRRQLLIQDATIEGAMQNHSKNKYSIGIYIDELFYLIEKMASKRTSEGIAWRTFLLQGNTNKLIDICRKTVESYRIERSCPTLLGSIQSQFLPQMFANGNLESGLIDRILFTTKLTNNDKLSDKDIPSEVYENYSKSLLNLLQYRDDVESTHELDSIEIEMESNSKERLFNYVQELINRQKSEKKMVIEYLSKMQINVIKITLLVHLMSSSKLSAFTTKITEATVETAILISDFFLNNFKIILEKNIQKSDKSPSLEDIIHVAIKNGANQKDVVAITGVHKSTVSRSWNKISHQLATDNLKLDQL